MKETSVHIGIDCDDVMVATAERSIEWFNKAYNNRLTLDDMFQRPTIEKYGTDDIRVVLARVAEFTLAMGDKLAPIDGAVETIDEWKRKGYSLHLITGRSVQTRSVTETAARRDFGDVFSSFEFTDSLNPETKRSKPDVCSQLGTLVMVDDLVIKDLPDMTTGIVFGEYPWNKDVALPPRAERSIDWGGTSEVVDRLVRAARQ